MATITSASITGGFYLEGMRQLQLDDDTVGQLLRAKETNQKPTVAYEKSQSIEYHRLSQQWTSYPFKMEFYGDISCTRTRTGAGYSWWCPNKLGH